MNLTRHGKRSADSAVSFRSSACRSALIVSTKPIGHNSAEMALGADSGFAKVRRWARFCRRAVAGPRHDRCPSLYVRAGELEGAVKEEAARVLANPELIITEAERLSKGGGSPIWINFLHSSDYTGLPQQREIRSS